MTMSHRGPHSSQQQCPFHWRWPHTTRLEQVDMVRMCSPIAHGKTTGFFAELSLGSTGIKGGNAGRRTARGPAYYPQTKLMIRNR